MAKAKKSSSKKGSFKLTINWKKFIISSIAVFVVLSVSDFIVHGNLLMDLYKQVDPRLMLDQVSSQARMNYMVAGNILFALFFVFLYTQGYSGGKTSFAEGLRYGIYVGLLIAVPHNVIMYMWSPYPMALLQAWAATLFVQIAILGAVTGLTYSHK